MNPIFLTRRQALSGAAALLAAAPLSRAAATDSPATETAILPGVNLAGAEFGEDMPGTLGTTYIYPDNASVDYYLSAGMSAFRIPFRWERLQKVLDGDLSAEDIDQLDRLVAHVTGRKARAILDLHNYGRRTEGGTSSIIGETDQVTGADLARFWGMLASRYKDDPLVVFGLMNEPHDQDTATLVSVFNETIAAIRATGANNLILVSGNHWSGAHSWASSDNGVAMLGIVDPAANYAFDVHQYLDWNSSGTGERCSDGAGETRLSPFTDWARETDQRGFLGEFGFSRNSRCFAEARAMLDHVAANSDVWIGWAYWAGGPWWGDYHQSIEPSSLQNPEDRPQMQVLLPYIEAAAGGAVRHAP